MVLEDDLSFSQTFGYAVLSRAATIIADALENGILPSPSLFEDDLFGGSPIEDFVRVFDLSVFERDLLILLSSLNIYPSLAETLGLAPGGNLDFNTALGVLTNQAHLEQGILTPTATLRHYKLVSFADEPQTVLLNSRPLLIDEWAFHALIGLVQLDGRLKTLVTPIQILQTNLSSLQQDLVARAARISNNFDSVIQISGAETELRLHIAGAVAGQSGRDLYKLNVARLEFFSVEDLAIRWNRFARLQDAALLIDVGDFGVGETTEKDPKLQAARSIIELLEGKIFVTSRVALAWGRETVTFEVKRPTTLEQRELWRAKFDLDRLSDADVIDLTSQFDFTSAQIDRVASDSVAEHSFELSQTLWNSSLALLRPALEGLTQRIEPAERATWSQLVLPERELSTLKRLVAHVKQRQHVYENWGWRQDSSRGFGIGALFGGSSGTGKTFSAEIIAKELGVDLQRIDLPSIVSKYIGESEKLLSKLFDAAEYGGCILLFDEADAIFGKRSEVKDANDRYANLEVSYLLQRMEAFRGLVILTTNQESNMDSAFMRRLRFVVQYPTPDVEARVLLWKKIFPTDTPIENLNYSALAKLEVSGGNIRSIALNAAFNAASDASPITMQHLLDSALEEIRKLKRLPRAGELDHWVR
jgi:ATPase family associated with various cellular activities (AAA)